MYKYASNCFMKTFCKETNKKVSVVKAKYSSTLNKVFHLLLDNPFLILQANSLWFQTHHNTNENGR